MTYINAKKQSAHSADYNKTNNGGLIVSPPQGATSEEGVGVKVTETPGVSGVSGINKTVVSSNVV